MAVRIPNQIDWLDRARFALSTLPDEIRSDIQDTVELLEHFPDTPTPGVVEIRDEADYYSIRSKRYSSYRLVFRYQKGRVTIAEILHVDWLKRLHAASRQAQQL